MRKRSCIAAMVVASLWFASSALAQESKDEHETGGRPENGYWSVGKPRWFAATQSEIGGIYAKPYFSVGYGMPHWIWAGLDVNSITTLGTEQLYGGLRVASPILTVQLGIRDIWSFERPFLTPRKSYSETDLDTAVGKNSHYTALEPEFVGVLPLPYAALVADFSILNVFDKPKDKYLYEETYRVVTKNSLFFVLRTTAVARLLAEGSVKIGLLTEFVFGTGREHAVIRMGPVLAVQLTDHLQIQAGVTEPVWSPDSLGLVNSAFGIFGVTYRAATDERNPALPWEGKIIPAL